MRITAALVAFTALAPVRPAQSMSRGPCWPTAPQDGNAPPCRSHNV